jgi:hypothetical protein
MIGIMLVIMVAIVLDSSESWFSVYIANDSNNDSNNGSNHFRLIECLFSVLIANDSNIDSNNGRKQSF